jgi:hypothetical protein
MAREARDVPGRGSVVAKQFDFEAVAFVMRRKADLNAGSIFASCRCYKRDADPCIAQYSLHEKIHE